MKTHGMNRTRIHRIYTTMKQRCTNPKNQAYLRYGGRGIKCEWKSCEEFIKDMFPTYESHLQLDRINNDGNYCKSNCRWVTPKQNSRNKRNNLFLKYKGKKYIASELAELYNISAVRLVNRVVSLGWSVNKALKTPVRYSKKSKH